METRKLYRENPYLTECEAQVLAADEHHVELDQTVFYAEAGGQVGDSGVISSLKIVDAQHTGGKQIIRQDTPVINVRTTILHVAGEAANAPAPGDVVKVSIDWERRYKIMRMHSAAHLVFYYTLKLYGIDGAHKLRGTPEQWHLAGCRIADDNARFDFYALERLQPSDLERIQDAANTLAARHLDIDYEVDENEPDLRYWRCGEIGMYCGGTHVRNTSEIGQITVRRRSQGKGLERVYLELAEAK